jgi:hypothetical protein
MRTNLWYTVVMAQANHLLDGHHQSWHARDVVKNRKLDTALAHHKES